MTTTANDTSNRSILKSAWNAAKYEVGGTMVCAAISGIGFVNMVSAIHLNNTVPAATYAALGTWFVAATLRGITKSAKAATRGINAMRPAALKGSFSGMRAASND